MIAQLKKQLEPSCEYVPGFLDIEESDRLLEISQSLDWQQNTIRMFGKEMILPRLEIMMGDPGCTYRYGNVTLSPLPWIPELKALRDRIEQKNGCRFPIVIGNLYRSGSDHIGWHSDDSPEMGKDPAIASISLGTTRQFDVRHNDTREKQSFLLGHGDFIFMPAGFQASHKHRIARSTQIQELRINWTFRPHINGAIELATPDNLETLAAEINRLHQEGDEAEATAMAAGKAALLLRKEEGDRLIAAKAEVGHGGWGKWLAENCPNVSGRTDRLYRQLAKGWDELSKSATVADLTLREAIALLPKKADKPVELPQPQPQQPPAEPDPAIGYVGNQPVVIKRDLGNAKVVEFSDGTVERFEADRVRATPATPQPAARLLMPVQSVAIESPPLPQQQYSCIVADPPWKYELRAEDETHRNRIPYPPMETEAILSLPVPDLCAKEGAILWLWTTTNFMPDACKCLEQWGFELKTILTWVKVSQSGNVAIGTGHWLRNATEFCLLATRGKVNSFRHLGTLTNQSTVLQAPRREHSRKPDEFYELVENLCPTTSKLEMFARQTRSGWESWGNEVNKFDQ